MGLDGVELVMETEGAFGIHLPDQRCSECSTVGDLYRLVLEQMALRGPVVCPGGHVFYRLRKAIPALRFSAVRPSEALGKGLPRCATRAQWSALSDELGLRLPALADSLKHLLLKAAGFGGATLLLAWVCLHFALPGWAAVIAFFVLLIPIVMAYEAIAGKLAFRVPGHSRSVKHFCHELVKLNGLDHHAAAMVDPELVWTKLRQIVGEAVGESPQAIHYHSRFVEDLHMD